MKRSFLMLIIGFSFLLSFCLLGRGKKIGLILATGD